MCVCKLCKVCCSSLLALHVSACIHVCVHVCLICQVWTPPSSSTPPPRGIYRAWICSSWRPTTWRIWESIRSDTRSSYWKLWRNSAFWWGTGACDLRSAPAREGPCSMHHVCTLPQHWCCCVAVVWTGKHVQPEFTIIAVLQLYHLILPRLYSRNHSWPQQNCFTRQASTVAKADSQ